jgi:hypothetical protein
MLANVGYGHIPGQMVDVEVWTCAAGAIQGYAVDAFCAHVGEAEGCHLRALLAEARQHGIIAQIAILRALHAVPYRCL